jgi:hypothetical protein
MAKKNKKGGFNIMDFAIVGGIAAVAYFLFSSFSKGPIRTDNVTNPVIPPNPTTPNPVIPPPAPNTGANTEGDFVEFTDKVINATMLKSLNNDVNAVKALQLYLTDTGYSTKGIDGVFGNDTENALDLWGNTSQLFPSPISLKDLGIKAVKFSTRQIFGNDPKSIFFNTIWEEYKGKNWISTNDAIKAYNGTL